MACWVILAAWIGHDAKPLGIRRGWSFEALRIVPGVAGGFALHLLLRMKQLATGRRERRGDQGVADARRVGISFGRATVLFLLLILDV